MTQTVNSAMRQYTYDLTDQLTNSTGASSYSATYDAVGNRTNADGATYTVANSINQYPYISTSGTLSYDANGNLGSWGPTNFWHDSQGQLTNLTAGTQSTAYQYDWRRLRVTGGTAAYTYDAGGNLCQIADGGNITQYVYVDGVDHAVLLRRNGTLYALITDHLGSVVAILNSAGNLVQSYDYTPFGRTSATGTDVGNVLGFTGREYDPASGLYYYRNRWYSPDLGRFIEPDPIGLAAWDLILYGYVENSPLILRDPSGLADTGTASVPNTGGWGPGAEDPANSCGNGSPVGGVSLVPGFYRWADLIRALRTPPPLIIHVSYPGPNTPIYINPPPPGYVHVPVYPAPNPPLPSPPGPIRLDPGPPSGVHQNGPPSVVSR